MRLGSEEYCKDVQGNPMYKNFAYCDACKTKTPMEHYYVDVTKNQYRHTRKITFSSLLKILRRIAGTMLIIAGILGIILCFYSKDIFTIIFVLVFTICFLSSGVYFLSPQGKKDSPDAAVSFPCPPECQPLGEVSTNAYTNNSCKPPAASDLFNDTYVIKSNTIHRIDGKAISDKEIPNLIQIGYENAVKAEENSKFHRTEREEELSAQFMLKYSYELDAYINQFESLYEKAYQTKNLSDKIDLLNETVKSFERARKFCYSKGKGGTIFFQDMYEYLHNSNNQCFSYLDNIKSSLDAAIYQKDVVIPNIMDVITQNDGIYQSKIYQFLPDINRTVVQHTLKDLEADDKISRIKKGNSYELHVKNE